MEARGGRALVRRRSKLEKGGVEQRGQAVGNATGGEEAAGRCPGAAGEEDQGGQAGHEKGGRRRSRDAGTHGRSCNICLLDVYTSADDPPATILFLRCFWIFFSITFLRN